MRGALLFSAVASCTTVLDYGPERHFTPGLLYRQTAEASSGSGRCDGESPALRARPPDAIAADCDSTRAPLEGAQSITIVDEGRVICDPCWEPKASVWASFDFRIDDAENYIAIPFELESDARPRAREPGEMPLDLRRTGALVSWGPDPNIRLYCETDKAAAAIPVAVSAARHVVFHFDWNTGRGELWVADVGSDPVTMTSTPAAATIACKPSSLLPTSWSARALVKPAPGRGAFSIDRISVAETRDGLVL
jgi:hypothetical protein